MPTFRTSHLDIDQYLLQPARDILTCSHPSIFCIDHRHFVHCFDTVLTVCSPCLSFAFLLWYAPRSRAASSSRRCLSCCSRIFCSRCLSCSNLCCSARAAAASFAACSRAARSLTSLACRSCFARLAREAVLSFSSCTNCKCNACAMLPSFATSAELDPAIASSTLLPGVGIPSHFCLNQLRTNPYRSAVAWIGDGWNGRICCSNIHG